MAMMKPICVPCRRFFRPKKNGQFFTEMMPAGDDNPPPGNNAPERWEPYKLWSGDLWHCPSCGSEIIVGVGAKPVSERHHRDFKEFREKVAANAININDC
jgi:hypothetical protein